MVHFFLIVSVSILSTFAFKLPSIISFSNPWNESYHIAVTCRGIATLTVDYVYNRKNETTLTLSSSYTEHSIISYHQFSYFESNTQYMAMLIEPTNYPQSTINLHLFVNNYDFIIPSIPVLNAAFCKITKPYPSSQISQLQIEQLTPPNDIQKLVSLLSNYRHKLSSMHSISEGLSIKLTFSPKYRRSKLWTNYIRLRLSFLFDDIATVSYVSKSRCHIKLKKQYSAKMLTQIETEISTRMNHFMWRICVEQKLKISKKDVLSNIAYLEMDSDAAEIIQPDIMELEWNDDFGSGFHPPTPLLNVSMLRFGTDESGDNRVIETIDHINNTPRILFLIAIVCGGILLMSVVMVIGVFYFCFKKLRWQVSRHNRKKAPILQNEKFEPVLNELRSFDFERKQREREEEEEKALIIMDTTIEIGEDEAPLQSPRDSFIEQLDDAIVVQEMVLDGIVNSMETHNKIINCHNDSA
eukprot:33144_1